MAEDNAQGKIPVERKDDEEMSKKNDSRYKLIPQNAVEGLSDVSLDPDPSPASSRMAIMPKTANESKDKKSYMEEECMRERNRATLLKECSHILKDEEYTKESLKKLFKNLEFMDKLFQLFDHDMKSFLVQQDWIEFLKEKLTEEKHIDLAEQIESVAYIMCGDDVVVLSKFLLIFQAKGIVEKVFNIIDKDNKGIVMHDEILHFVSNITKLRHKAGFDQSSLEWLENLFRQTVGNEKEIKKEDFQKIVMSKNPFFTERVFDIFDNDKSGTISFEEFLEAIDKFSGQTPEDKIKFLFKVYDEDGDGLIQLTEMRRVLRACMDENGMTFNEEQIGDLADAFFEEADPENVGAITYEELKRQLEKHGGLLENLSISIDRWLVPPKPKEKPKSVFGVLKSYMPHQFSKQYIKNNYVYLIFFGAFVLVNLGLFISRVIQYYNMGANIYTIIARGCGQCLNFNCAWILVLMLRNSITFLRTRGFASILPLDQHIYFHKVTGVLIFIQSILHTIMHLLNFSLEVVNNPVINANNYTLYEWLMTSKPGLFGLIGGWANPTGIALAFILTFMFICSQPFVRKGGSFEVFYWSHLLYIPFWILVIFHGPNFWKWFIAPGVIYITERLYRLVWISRENKTYISTGLLLPSKVTHLVIKRPLHFDYHPGDYVFIKIPAIAKYEWHPFTISSAPEEEGYIWLHIRGVGQWTNRLYSWFEEEHERLKLGQDPKIATSIAEEAIKKFKGQIERRLSGMSTSSMTNNNGTLTINDKKKKSVELIASPYIDKAYQIDEEDEYMHDANNKSVSSSTEDNSQIKFPQRKILDNMTLHGKAPFEKTHSMPEIVTKTRAQQRIENLRKYVRSESERHIDKKSMKSVVNAVITAESLTSHNKPLVESLRFMRNKPAIIAFKTPSLISCDQREPDESIITTVRRRLSHTLNPDKDKIKDLEVGKAESSEFIDEESNGAIATLPIRGPLEVYIDGPYGAPSSHIFRAQHAVLVATGIGVTPFASILKSIMIKYWKARQTCPKCSHSWTNDISAKVMNLKKVDFFWINREQKSFEWFLSLLSQLEMEQAEMNGPMERFLDMHMYITSALQKNDMKAVGLQLALDLLHEKGKRDLITGLKTRTNAGRPNWDKVFKKLESQKKGKVTVFYCGPPQLAKALRIKCDQYRFNFRKESF